MSEFSLKYFSIEGLNGYRNIKAEFKDNRLILVGDNGSNKTTFLRIFFLFLSAKWNALSQFNFKEIEINIDNIVKKLAYEELDNIWQRIERRYLKDYSIDSKQIIIETLSKNDNVIKIRHELEGYNISLPNIIIHRIKELHTDSLLDSHKIDEIKGNKKLNELKIFLYEKINSQILYLPTYRRIEKELENIFNSEFVDEYNRSNRFKYRSNYRQNSYIEFVEFGMKDVQYNIDNVLENLKDFSRENLNNLTSNYLNEIINKEYENFDISRLNKLTGEDINKISLNLKDNDNFSEIPNIIMNLIGEENLEKLTDYNKIILHYFTKLLDFQDDLDRKSQKIRDFCQLCSDYMSDKIFVFDSQMFDFKIELKGSNEEKNVSLKDLSSGEKQIVSLFSHIYLSEQSRFFVLIDEPELSLSVPWQNRFLLDISQIDSCKGIMAVTHSPFIYDNDLSGYARGIGEFEY